MLEKPVQYDPRLKKKCKHCIRARWMLTGLILGTMLLILYFDQFAQ
jgi:hypothetical protein